MNQPPVEDVIGRAICCLMASAHTALVEAGQPPIKHIYQADDGRWPICGHSFIVGRWTGTRSQQESDEDGNACEIRLIDQFELIVARCAFPSDHVGEDGSVWAACEDPYGECPQCDEVPGPFEDEECEDFPQTLTDHSWHMNRDRYILTRRLCNAWCSCLAECYPMLRCQEAEIVGAQNLTDIITSGRFVGTKIDVEVIIG